MPFMYAILVGAVGIEPATLSQAVQCLCHSTSRKLVDGLLQQQRLQSFAASLVSPWAWAPLIPSALQTACAYAEKEILTQQVRVGILVKDLGCHSGPRHHIVV